MDGAACVAVVLPESISCTPVEVALRVELDRDEVLEVRPARLRHGEQLLDLRDRDQAGVEAIIRRQRAGVLVEQPSGDRACAGTG